MTEIEKTYSGKPLRIYIEDGEVLLSVRDLCWLLGDRNPNRKLQRAGIDNARYRSLDTNGGVQRMRLVSPRECETLLGSLRATSRLLALRNWLKGVFEELAAVKCDFCGGC